jgi:hypothetical protein
MWWEASASYFQISWCITTHLITATAIVAEMDAKLYSFSGEKDGAFPYGGLVAPPCRLAIFPTVTVLVAARYLN